MPKIKQSVIKKPCITVGTITTPAGLTYLKSKEVEVDIVEVRVDSLRSAGMEIPEIKTALKARKMPTLLTLRTMVEGGDYPWKSTERILVFEELISYADAIDLEIKNMKYVKPILQIARDTNKKVILSTHSLERKLTIGKAERLVETFRAYRVDIYKMVMATGPMAQVSRVVLPSLGSKLVYGYLDEPAAPGQPSAQELKGMLLDCGLK